MRYQKGSIILLAVMMISILMIIGLIAFQIGFTEYRIINNEYANQVAFYSVEGICSQALNHFLSINRTLLYKDIMVNNHSNYYWIHPEQEINCHEIHSTAYWTDEMSYPISKHGRYLVIFSRSLSRYAKGHSLRMTSDVKQKPFRFILISRFSNQKQSAMIETGVIRYLSVD